jgi:hypothetical protein
MLNTIRHWHWTLLHRVFGLPDHDHVEPGTPLSAVLHPHPPIPAHGKHFAQPKQPGFQEQLDREMQRQPLVLKSWQQRIGAAVERQAAKRRLQ